MRLLTTVTAILTILVPSLLQASSAAPHCGEFEVARGDGKIEYIDVNGNGLSIGDRRAGSYDLIGPEGDVVGQFLFESTIASEQDGIYVLIGEAHVVFENGVVLHPITYELTDPTVSVTPATALLYYAYDVIGGVGDFEDADGVAKYRTGDDGVRVFRYELDC